MLTIVMGGVNERPFAMIINRWMCGRFNQSRQRSTVSGAQLLLRFLSPAGKNVVHLSPSLILQTIHINILLFLRSRRCL